MDAAAGSNILSFSGAARSGFPAGASVSDEPLASLEGLALSSRFCAWRGGSDLRYVASVYPVDRSAADDGLPAFEGFVLIAVACGPLGRRIVEVAAIERESDRVVAIASGRARGADEWHVHFLAAGRRERAALVADLQARHGATGSARCA